MTDKTLRELVEEASSAISTYKNPSISEAKSRLNDIVKSAGLGNLEYESIDGISFYKGMIELSTSYSVRGCMQSGEYIFPESILDEPDPVAAAKRWGIQKKISDAQESVDEARRDLEGREETLAEALAELANLDAALV
jgi:hypothetical protein